MDMAYIAKCKCGGMVMAVVDLPDTKKAAAKEVASCLRAGFEIERITVEEVKIIPFCKNHGKCEEQKESDLFIK
jgi:hypothetical protein